MSSIRDIWEKMRTREPLAFMDLSSLSSTTILPALKTRCSSVVKGGPGSCEDQAIQISITHAAWLQSLRLKTDSAIKEVGVVAALAQLHDNVEQTRLALLLAAHACKPKYTQ